MPRIELQTGLVAGLALKDYRHEIVMSACHVLALGAVLLPLLVLFGLKFGMIENLLAPLKDDPRYRQILPTGSGRYTTDWFEQMAARDDVEFIVPRTRAIAATMRVRMPSGETGRIIRVEMIPSGAGDPVLEEQVEPAGLGQVVLSLDAADKLGAATGASLEGIVSRTLRGEEQVVRLPLTVAGVASAAAFRRDGLFVSPELLVAVEDFRDGRAVPELGWAGNAPASGPRSFAGFRLYAKELEDVAGLRQGLMDLAVDVRTELADIELVQTLDRNLSVVFWIIASIAALGFVISFGTSVWAGIDRKRREFSVLRLTGFRTRGIVWFPILQSALTAVLGWLLAIAVFFIVQVGLNALFVANIGGGEPVCRLLPHHFAIALLLALVAALSAAALGGWRLAQLEPSLGLRET